jgi:hypothetical protein
MTEKRYEPRIYLATDIVQAGCDMIQTIGMLKGETRCGEDFSSCDWTMEQLRDAVRRANAALANYDRAIAHNLSLMTRAEFNAEDRT